MSMMVDSLCFIEQFHDGQKCNLYERNELSKDEPNVHHSDVGGGGQLLHHTGVGQLIKYSLCLYQSGYLSLLLNKLPPA